MKNLFPILGAASAICFSASTSFAATYYSFDTSIHPEALCADGTTAGNGINITVAPVVPYPIVRNCRTEIGRFVGPKGEIFSMDDTLP